MAHLMMNGIFVQKHRGVRRPRDESAVEIEELDSETMRQNSYNYFQQQHARRAARSRKRQRTLAEQLDGLSLHGANSVATTASDYGSSYDFKPIASQSGKLSNAINGDVWNNEELRDNLRSYRGRSRFEDMNTNTDDNDDDDNDHKDDNNETRRSDNMMVYGTVPSMRDFFFDGSSQPMDRMFSQYASAGNANASIETRGNELVVFRPIPPPKYVVNLPYFSLTHEELTTLAKRLTPEELEALMLRATTQKESDSFQGVNVPLNEHNQSRNGDSSNKMECKYADRPDYGEIISADEDVDMDGDGDKRVPHLAGAISHSEWFLDQEL